MELIITTAMVAILTVVMAYIFRAILLSWSGQETRAGIDIGLNRGIEEMVQDLRKAQQVVSQGNDEIRFTQDKSTYYIYYFYNSGDTYPLNFNQSLYQLRKAVLSGGIAGTFTYGSGNIIISDLLPPSTSNLSFSGNIVNIDLSIKRKDETIRSIAQVTPRNMLSRVCCSVLQDNSCTATCPTGTTITAVEYVKYGASKCGNCDSATGADCRTKPSCVGATSCSWNFNDTNCVDTCPGYTKTGYLTILCQ
ncbi:MAG: hypothetical protein ABSE81_03070 [Candidatus Omnitrophota bacterium]|jgi:hypothetical protein